MKTSDFDYILPSDLIAQQPAAERSSARMLVLHRSDGSLEHRSAGDIGEYLRRGDVMVVNNTRVIPARVFGRKEASGGRVEVLLLEELAPDCWEALLHASGRMRPGWTLKLAGNEITAKVTELGEGGKVTLELTHARPLLAILADQGHAPLPPYIKRAADAEAGARASSAAADRDRYQTVYAEVPGAVAAPTAGLHFTPEMLAGLEQQGVQRVAVTLHVGLGTFRPVKTEVVEEHRMETERYAMGAEAVAAVSGARAAGGRIIAVGTTSVRVLESIAAAHDGVLVPETGRTRLFVYPPYRFRVVDGLLTNFHLPRSTLLMLVSAFAGRERLLQAYEEAVRQRYRFYSYGDCMLIL